MQVSKKRRELMIKLSEIWNDIDFILGVDVHLKTESSVNAMLNYLHDNRESDLKSDQVLKKALEIRYNHEITI